MATFRQLPSGRWQARVYRNGRYESIGTFESKKEAELNANEAEKRIYYGRNLTDRDLLFGDVIDEWFEEKRREVKESTYTQLESAKRLHIEPYFRDRKIHQITRQDITDWIKLYEDKKDRYGQHYSIGSRERFLTILKDIFNYAVFEMEVLERSPALKLNVGSKGTVKIKDDIKYYTLDELNQLLDYLRQYNPPRYKEYKLYYVLVYFLSRTGLRISEALGLRWSDINLNRLDVNKQTTRDHNNKLTISTLKTQSSYRNIELDDDTVQLLSWFRKVQQKMTMKHKSFKRNKDFIIFQVYNGNYLTPSTVRDTLKSHCFNAGVEYMGTHVFRHTHAVLSLEAGASLSYISKRLGHGSIQTTHDKYIDVTPQFESNELAKISAHLNSNMAQTRQIDINAKK